MNGYLAIDFGGTRTRAAWFDASLAMQHRAEAPTHAEQPQAAVLDRIIDLARGVIPAGAAPFAVGVAAPGPLDAPSGTILHAETLPGWRDVPLAAILRDALHAPVYVQNDANLGVLAEAKAGAAQGLDVVLYLTLSTGIGGGATVGGQLFTGANGLAIEPGHQVFRLADGRVKKLEELASGTALGRIAAERLATNPDTPTALRDSPTIDGKAVGAAALAGDPFALALVREAAGWLGLGLVNLLHLFNPQAIVLGGSVTRLGDVLLAPLRETIAQHVLAPGFLTPDFLRVSALGDDVCLIGAAHYAHTMHTPQGSQLIHVEEKEKHHVD